MCSTIHRVTRIRRTRTRSVHWQGRRSFQSYLRGFRNGEFYLQNQNDLNKWINYLNLEYLFIFYLVNFFFSIFFFRFYPFEYYKSFFLCMPDEQFLIYRWFFLFFFFLYLLLFRDAQWLCNYNNKLILANRITKTLTKKKGGNTSFFFNTQCQKTKKTRHTTNDDDILWIVV